MDEGARSLGFVRLVSIAMSGCTIADVTVAPGEDRLVVEAVLRTDTLTQRH